MVNNPYIDKSEQRAKLLVKYLLNLTRLIAIKKKTLIGKLKLKSHSQKIQITKNTPIIQILNSEKVRNIVAKEIS